MNESDETAAVRSTPALPEPEAPPPLLGSWRNLYALVLGTLVLLVVAFWAITRVFNVGEGP